MKKVTQDEILTIYRVTKVIKVTARNLGISEQAVRKTLISNGAYTSPTAQRVQELHNIGMSTKQIALHLRMSRSAVSSYLPYKRRPYLEQNRSKNAANLARWRQKKKRRDKK